FWRGANSMLGEFALRFTGSPDLYKDDYRRPTASINFVTAHDGFTLHDLVSYNEKHNEANGEGNNDGESHNRSWNCGVEGQTDNEDIIELRQKQKRNLLTTLFLSQGVPMLVAGDEISRTQGGNNNAYCQDNDVSWINWEAADTDLLDFTRKLIQLYQTHHVFSRRRWFQGMPVKGVGLEDIAWFLPQGVEMNEINWKNDFAKSLGVYLNGHGLRSVDEKGEKIIDNDFYIIFNAYDGPLDYTLPSEKYGDKWIKILDTDENYIREEGDVFLAGDIVRVKGTSVVLLKQG
ncbi:MAG: glycogen debranching enzyme GlgX, partial [Flavisolibacter sp.]